MSEGNGSWLHLRQKTVFSLMVTSREDRSLHQVTNCREILARRGSKEDQICQMQAGVERCADRDAGFHVLVHFEADTDVIQPDDYRAPDNQCDTARQQPDADAFEQEQASDD